MTVLDTPRCIWFFPRSAVWEKIPGLKDNLHLKIVCLLHPVSDVSSERVKGAGSISNRNGLITNTLTLNSSSERKSKSCAAKAVQASLQLEDDLASLSLDLKNLSQSAALADVQLKCDHQTFPAHKAVLAARSKIFSDMFKNEKSESRPDIVDVPDVDASVIELFLKYIYCGRVTVLSEDTAPRLYAAGDKYAVQSLKKVCSDWMIGHLRVENCLTFLTVADAHSDLVFKDAVVSFISRNKAVFTSEAWTQLSESSSKLVNEVYHQCFVKPNINK